MRRRRSTPIGKSFLTDEERSRLRLLITKPMKELTAADREWLQAVADGASKEERESIKVEAERVR